MSATERAFLSQPSYSLGTADDLSWSFSYKEYMFKHVSFQWPITSDQVRDSVLASIEDGDWGAYHGKYTSQLIADLQQLLSVDLSLIHI